MGNSGSWVWGMRVWQRDGRVVFVPGLFLGWQAGDGKDLFARSCMFSYICTNIKERIC